MSDRHAYLIMAHEEFGILEKLLMLLDDARNDIYLHIDSKAGPVDRRRFQSLLKSSHLFFTERMDVRWGDFSQIRCELLLLRTAVAGSYGYYHLLSGVDLPLKSNAEIHSFFRRHSGREFVHFTDRERDGTIIGRIAQYHLMRLPLQKHRVLRKLPRAASYLLVWLQRKLGLRRPWDEACELVRGSQWFSITHGFAEYVLSRERWIYRYFRHTFCPDELVIQTLLYNSPFMENVYWDRQDDDYRANMRHIDWKRGDPYVWKNSDFQELITSDRLWARKFSAAADGELVQRLYAHLTRENAG